MNNRFIFIFWLFDLRLNRVTPVSLANQAHWECDTTTFLQNSAPIVSIALIVLAKGVIDTLDFILGRGKGANGKGMDVKMFQLSPKAPHQL